MIRRFYVHNFRCLENFELPIASTPTMLLIGGNGSGKSTVGFALEILQKIARGENSVDKLVKSKDLSRGRAEVPMRLEIEVEFDGSLYEYTLAFELPAGFKALRVRDENLKIDGKPIYSRQFAEIHLHKSGSRPDATFGLDWHYVALPIIQLHSSADKLSAFKQLIARSLIFRPVPVLISGESNKELLEPDTFVSNFGDWFFGITRYAPAAYSQISKYLKQVMPDFKEIKNQESGIESRSMFVEFSNETSVVSIPFNDLSDGEKCFMICSVVLAANEVYGPIICYWDEPDCYLAPHEVSHFVMALRQSFESKGQFITTSHSPEAIQRFSDDNTIVLHRRNHLEPTTVHLLASLNRGGDLAGALIRGEIVP